MSPTTKCWLSHARGVTNIMIARGAGACGGEVDRTIFYTTYKEAVSGNFLSVRCLPRSDVIVPQFVDGMMSGSNSVFDSPDWLDMSPSPDEAVLDPHNCTHASKLIMRLETRLPRLAKMVRRALHEDLDSTATAFEAMQLAKDLYGADLSSWEEGLRHSGAVEVVEDQQDERFPMPNRLTFDSFHLFETLIHYWAGRTLLLGLMIALASNIDSLRQMEPVLDMPNLTTEDEQVALNLAMSVPYATSVGPRYFGALAMLLPLQYSFGTWHRKAKRTTAAGGKEKERQHGQEMKRWIHGTLMKMARSMGTAGGPIQWLEIVSEMMSGALIPPWLARTR